MEKKMVVVGDVHFPSKEDLEARFGAVAKLNMQEIERALGKKTKLPTPMPKKTKNRDSFEMLFNRHLRNVVPGFQDMKANSTGKTPKGIK